MAAKRRLPVLQEPPRSRAEPDVGHGAGGADEDPPPWHWVPLGAGVSVAVGAVLARALFMPLLRAQAERLCPTGTAPAACEQLLAHAAPSALGAMHLRLALAGFAIAMASVAVGGFVVGRFGPRTHPRHGALAGISALALLVLLGRAVSLAGLLAYMALIPLGGLAGYWGARLGARLR